MENKHAAGLDAYIDEKVFLTLLALFVILLKSPVFAHPPTDYDEGVYMHLAQHMTWTLGGYNTIGTTFDKLLSGQLYHAPIFIHPPLIPYIIKIVSSIAGWNLGYKLVNIFFAVASIFPVFFVAKRFSGLAGAALASIMWVLCPLFNLQSTLIHLDFPMAVFFLYGVWLFLAHTASRRSKALLYASAIFFALCMLSKYTAPVYIITPVLLAGARAKTLKNFLNYIPYIVLCCLGFCWWIYFTCRMGSLFPDNYVATNYAVFTSGYLDSVRQRSWIHIWLYFTAICPLFLIYLGGTASSFIKAVSPKSAFLRDDEELLSFTINLSSISCAAITSFIIILSNANWIFRYYICFFPVIYIFIAYYMINIFNNSGAKIRSVLILSFFISIASMSASSFITLLNITGLRVIPALLFWIPGLKDLFI